MRKYAGISLTVTSHSAPLRLAYSFASKKLQNPSNQVDHFKLYFKTDISKIVPFKHLKLVGGP
jgi:hypothetical protein